MKDKCGLAEISSEDMENSYHHSENGNRFRRRLRSAIPGGKNKKRAMSKFVGKRLPITKWIRRCNKTSLYYDVIAGITVGLMLVPQSLAYSALAGLPPEYGLYSSYCGVLVYFIFGTSKDLQTGPAALVAMLVDKFTTDGEQKVMYATSLALFSGITLIVMSVFRLQFLINFISVPVLAGFTSAAAIKIGVSQLKGMFGLSIQRGHFFHTVYNNFANLKQARVADSLLGFACLAIFIALRRVGAWNMGRKVKKGWPATSKKILWFVCSARFTLAVLVTTVTAQILYERFEMQDFFTLAGDMASGIPPPKVPLSDVISNGTLLRSKIQVVQHLGIGCVITPLVAFLETIAVAKTLSRKNNYKIDVTQELFSLGIVNVFGSFFSAFPVAGSFSRSALNSQCSVKTQLGGFFTGLVVLLAASFMTPWFKYIPKATLSAMIIAAVIPLFEYHIVPMLWKTKKIDIIPMAVTFFVCFYETEFGILAGVAVALCIYIYESIQLHLSQEQDDAAVVFSVGSQAVGYPNIDQLISRLEKVVRSKKSKPSVIVLEMENVTRVDSTAATALKQFCLSVKTSDINAPKIVFRKLQDRPKRALSKIGIEIEEDLELMETEGGTNEQKACEFDACDANEVRVALYPNLQNLPEIRNEVQQQ